MERITGRIGISAVIVALTFSVVFLLGIGVGGVSPLVLYLMGLLLGSVAVAFLASRLGVKPGDLARTALTIVPVFLVVVLGLLKVIAPLLEEPVSGPTEGEGFMIALLFLLLPAVLLGLLGSLFELPLWEDRRSSVP